MKKQIAIFAITIFWLSATAQETKKIIIDIGFNKRTTFIFPALIEDDACGSELLSVDKNKNKLYIIANKKAGFPNTSLYVELATGHYYDIELKFNSLENHRTTVPISLNEATGIINLQTINSTSTNPLPKATTEAENQQKPTGLPITSETASNALDPMSAAQQVSEKSRNVYTCEAFDRGLYFALESLYTYNNQLFLKINIENKSNIEYEIQTIEFAIVGKEKIITKSPNNNGQPLPEPIAVYNKDKTKISAKSKVTQVYVYEKFTLSDKKKLNIKIFEKGGDREVSFDIEGKTLLKASELKP
jgi:hypothetical protein